MKVNIFNPFIKIAGIKALLIGLVFIAATIVLGYYSKTRIDGIFDIHNVKDITIWISLSDSILSWLSSCIIFYLVAISFSSSKVRLIDISGTLALARFPMLFAVIAGFGMRDNKFSDFLIASFKAEDSIVEFSNSEMYIFILIALVSVFLAIWTVVLIFNAYKISSNIKGQKLTFSFILALILSEVLAKFLLYKFPTICVFQSL